MVIGKLVICNISESKANATKSGRLLLGVFHGNLIHLRTMKIVLDLLLDGNSLATWWLSRVD